MRKWERLLPSGYSMLCLYLVAVVLGSVGCQSKAVRITPAIPETGYTNITAAELKAMLEERGGEFVLLDVRQPEEYMEGHIEWSVLMPVGDIYERYTELDQEKEVVVYCRSGWRSGSAGKILSQLGFRKVKNLEGGISGWPYPILK